MRQIALGVLRVCHAQIVPYERRQYLECWCEEIEGNRELPELQHNWTLRLDRIPDAALKHLFQLNGAPIWMTLEIEIHLLRGLAFAYESKNCRYPAMNG